MNVEKKYSMGEKNQKWTLTQKTIQKGQSYKFVFSDDESNEKIETNFITPYSAFKIEEIALNIVDAKADRLECISDFYVEFQKTSFGVFFSYIN